MYVSDKHEIVIFINFEQCILLVIMQNDQIPFFSGQPLQSVCQPGGIVALAAAHVQNLAGNAKFLSCIDQRPGNGGIVARFQKFPPGQHLFSGIAGI